MELWSRTLPVGPGSDTKSPLEQTFIYAPNVWLFFNYFFFFQLLFVINTFISFFQPTINNYGDDNDSNAVGW